MSKNKNTDQEKLENSHEAQLIVDALYRYVLRRNAGEEEALQWLNYIKKGAKISDVIEKFGTCDEYKDRYRVTPYFPLGHYYSPVVDATDSVREYVLAQPGRVGRTPAGINMNIDAMKNFIQNNSDFINLSSLNTENDGMRRFYSNNGGFPLGDALILRSILKHFKPKRIVEIGSGHSTACMLDVLDEMKIGSEIICIEPYPARLRALIRPSDNIEIIEDMVQNVSLEKFSALDKGDILFIDSTHVLKTGSDVHYELFEILPALKNGVIIHFHDLMYPFEYPLDWALDKNYSWNEAYAVRAFLMYNNQFCPFFSGSLLMQHEKNFFKDQCPNFPDNPGSHLWVEKICNINQLF